MTRSMRQAFGERVREVRTQRKLTQAQLGELVVLPHSSISKLENGQQGVSIEQALRIAIALRTTPGWLLFGAEDDAVVELEDHQHTAGEWRAWLGGLSPEPLPGWDRRDFFRTATFDHTYTARDAYLGETPIADQQLRIENANAALRPLREEFKRIADMMHRAGIELAQLRREAAAAGYEDFEEYLDTLPEDGQQPVPQHTRRESGEEGETR